MVTAAEVEEIDLPELSDEDLKALYWELRDKLKEAEATTHEAHLWVSTNMEIKRRVDAYRRSFIRR